MGFTRDAELQYSAFYTKSSECVDVPGYLYGQDLCVPGQVGVDTVGKAALYITFGIFAVD